MPINELNGVTQYVMDLVGIFSFALSGAFIAVRRDFDVFGTVILSEAAGLGGGLFRDLVLQVPPARLHRPRLLLHPVGAAAAVYFGHRLYDDLLVRRSVLFDVPDAGALGLFSVTGTIKALTHGFNVPAAVTLGAASAVGGGVLASVLAMEVPSLLRWDSDLYALPAVAGAARPPSCTSPERSTSVRRSAPRCSRSPCGCSPCATAGAPRARTSGATPSRGCGTSRSRNRRVRRRPSRWRPTP